jgi:hypothetical protein
VNFVQPVTEQSGDSSDYDQSAARSTYLLTLFETREMDGKDEYGKDRPAARSTAMRGFLVVILLVVQVLDLILIYLAADRFNKTVDHKYTTDNPISNTVNLLELIVAGFVGTAVQVGLTHMYYYNTATLICAYTTATLGWGINLLACGFTAKEASLGNHYHNSQSVVACQYIIWSMEVLFTAYMVVVVQAFQGHKAEPL